MVTGHVVVATKSRWWSRPVSGRGGGYGPGHCLQRSVWLVDRDLSCGPRRGLQRRGAGSLPPCRLEPPGRVHRARTSASGSLPPQVRGCRTAWRMRRSRDEDRRRAAFAAGWLAAPVGPFGQVIGMEPVVRVVPDGVLGDAELRGADLNVEFLAWLEVGGLYRHVSVSIQKGPSSTIAGLAGRWAPAGLGAWLAIGRPR